MGLDHWPLPISIQYLSHPAQFMIQHASTQISNVSTHL